MIYCYVILESKYGIIIHLTLPTIYYHFALYPCITTHRETDNSFIFFVFTRVCGNHRFQTQIQFFEKNYISSFCTLVAILMTSWKFLMYRSHTNAYEWWIIVVTTSNKSNMKKSVVNRKRTFHMIYMSLHLYSWICNNKNGGFI